MSEIDVTVLGKKFTVQCGEGQEEHVKSLVSYFSGRLRDVELGAVNSNSYYLLLMAAILVCDDFFSARAEIEDRQSQKTSNEEIKNLLLDLEKRIDTVCKSLEKV